MKYQYCEDFIWPFPEDPVFSQILKVSQYQRRSTPCPREAEIRKGSKKAVWGIFLRIQFLKTFCFYPLCSENHTNFLKVYTTVKATTVVDGPEEAAVSQLRVVQTTLEAERSVRAEIHLSN